MREDNLGKPLDALDGKARLEASQAAKAPSGGGVTTAEGGSARARKAD